MRDRWNPCFIFNLDKTFRKNVSIKNRIGKLELLVYYALPNQDQIWSGKRGCDGNKEYWVYVQVFALWCVCLFQSSSLWEERCAFIAREKIEQIEGTLFSLGVKSRKLAKRQEFQRQKHTHTRRANSSLSSWETYVALNSKCTTRSWAMAVSIHLLGWKYLMIAISYMMSIAQQAVKVPLAPLLDTFSSQFFKILSKILDPKNRFAPRWSSTCCPCRGVLGSNFSIPKSSSNGLAECIHTFCTFILLHILYRHSREANTTLEVIVAVPSPDTCL